jgi:hypothetical protein
MMRRSGLLYKPLELEFFAGLIKLIASFLTDRKFKVSVEDKFSTPRAIVAVQSIYCHDFIVTIEGFWIDDSIYCTV